MHFPVRQSSTISSECLLWKTPSLNKGWEEALKKMFSLCICCVGEGEDTKKLLGGFCVYFFTVRGLWSMGCVCVWGAWGFGGPKIHSFQTGERGKLHFKMEEWSGGNMFCVAQRFPYRSKQVLGEKGFILFYLLTSFQLKKKSGGKFHFIRVCFKIHFILWGSQRNPSLYSEVSPAESDGIFSKVNRIRTTTIVVKSWFRSLLSHEF